MGYSPEALFRLFLESVLFGGILGIVYGLMPLLRLILFESCVIRISERLERQLRFRAKASCSESMVRSHLIRISVFLEDLLFCLTAAVGLLLLAFVGNEGRIRWLLPIGMLIGFLLFRVMLGRPMARLLGYLAFTVRFLALCLTYPIRLIAGVVCEAVLRVYGAIRDKRQERAERRFREREAERILSLAERGFGCPTAKAE